MLCERQGIYHAQINTNNYIEFWYRTLKARFFKQRRAKRVDRVIYVLSQQAAPFFFRKTIESSVGVGRVSKKQKKVRAALDRAFEHLALKRTSGYQGRLINPVSTTDSSTFEVESFSDPATSQEQKEVTNIVQDLITILSNVNVKALIEDEETVCSLKRTRE
ncbi:hypothetical protein BGZ65_003645 [Modicella reniformis]|uniref:Uncharacterized protein n=1 Tax=Modicella reniformis TaxID=1440133 RepID=A0A9P6MHM7_9FUNG|nr:hypothetical protein BGZ65_003645 [Modicella reniformis]